jgi:hypothetical protein
LIDPIIVTEFEGEDAIVDERNRFKACGLAGVEPRFEGLNGKDAREHDFVAARGRRNVSKGQQAMAIAMLYPEPKRGRGNVAEAHEKTKREDSASFRRVKEARQILRHSLELARAVRDDGIKAR